MWSVSMVQRTQLTYPYQAVDVSGGAVGTPYYLPFSPQSVNIAQQPDLVLGENGVAFASGMTTATVNGTQTQVSQIASFNLSSGAPNWTYQAGAQYTLSIVVSEAGNGLVAKTTAQNQSDTIIRFDSTGVPTVDQWTGTGIDYFVSDLWTGAGSSGVTVYSAPLIQFSTSGWSSPKQEGSNKSEQAVHVTNASSSGPKQATIAGVFGKIETALNANPQSTCSAWLQGSSTDATTLIQAILSENNFGHGSFNLITKAAFSWGVNPDKSSTGIPSNFSVTVNDNGAFFNSSFVVGKRKYTGNGIRAQATILIHELGHLLSHAGSGAAGFQDDFGDSSDDKRGKSNDGLVDQNCKTLIEGLQ